MKKNITQVVFLIALLSGINVHAALIDRGTGMIYDTDLGITYLQDANYARTSGYDSDGLMNQSQALKWASDLEYAGYSDWRLPSFRDTMGAFHLSELGHLLSVENITYDSPGPFTNIQQYIYTATPYQPGLYWLSSPGYGQNIGDTHGAYTVGPNSNYWNSMAVRDGDCGPSVSVGSDYVTSLVLGDTFSFDYLWLMGQETTDFNLDIFYFRDNSWHLLGGDIIFDGSSSEWEIISYVVPHELRGIETQIRFGVLDFGADTDPTVYLRNIASNGSAPVPEPATMLLLGTGLLGLAGFRKKLKR